MIGEAGAGGWVLGAGYWILDVGYWILGAGYWKLGAGCWILEKITTSFCFTYSRWAGRKNAVYHFRSAPPNENGSNWLAFSIT